MRNVLGLHFGHDGAACVIADGRILGYLLTERRTRVKHAGGVPSLVIDEVLRHAGLRPEDIDLVTVTSTQNRECVFDNPAIFSFEFGGNALDLSVDDGYERIRPRLTFAFRVRAAHRDRQANPRNPNLWQWPYFSESMVAAGYPTIRFRVNRVEHKKVFDSAHGRAGIAACTLPINCTLFGRRVPGFFVDHHAAHCASVFYKSSFDEAVVVSADGGSVGNFGGFVMLGHGGRLSLIETHEFIGGGFYTAISGRIGLDPGKLMGLAGHGQPKAPLLGLRHRDLEGALDEFLGRAGPTALAEAANDPLSASGRGLAADAQASFEAGFTAMVVDAVDYLTPLIAEPALCLSGGCALNCPSNSILMQRFGDQRVFIESACNDEGLAFGGAAWAYANILGGVIDAAARTANRSPFQGSYPTEVQRALERARAQGFELIAGASARAAMVEAVLHGDIGGVMRGKSEIGPRALGNRSIIGRADLSDHHRRINAVKRREQWRPLAPMLPERLFGHYFEGPRNPYMLATCRVKTDRTPSARHADGSARVQVINGAEVPNDGLFSEIAAALEANDRPGVLMNTSLNGREQPLVDDACDAVELLRRNDDLRYLLIEDHLVRKPGSPAIGA